MTCVTPADLGKPIAAIVERCGAPQMVFSMVALNMLSYGDGGRLSIVWFDSDQMRARILQFGTVPPEPAQPRTEWALTLPFESGAREVALGKETLAGAQSALAIDADVTMRNAAAFHSTARNDVVLTNSSSDSSSSDDVLGAALIGERISLIQLGLIARPIDEAPLKYTAPYPLDNWAHDTLSTPGSRATIVRIDVDAEGIARKVTIAVASGDAPFDALLQQRFGDATFLPATLGNRPVSGPCFLEVHH